MLKRTILMVALVAVTAGCTKPKGAAPKDENPKQHLEGGKLIFEDSFDRKKLGDDWKQTTGRWSIVDGWAHSAGDKNAGLWLNQKLPERVRVELDARSESRDGDIKFEIFSESQEHQGGYVCILGGWDNTLSIIARRDEHGKDRLTSTERLVERGKTYHFSVVRTGSTLHWFVNGELFMSYPDDAPVRGRYFGLNDWASKLYFDNIEVYEL